MPSIFSKIISGEIPCYKIAENENFFAFLDIFPLAKGHALVIPKKEVDYIFDLEPSEYQQLFAFAQKIAKAIDKVCPCKKVGIAVIGLEVAHAHIHLVPLNEISDLDFSKPKLSFTTEEFASLAKQIAENL
ncbi:MAG: HIT family protein [Bacteroidales bacterium]